MTALLDNLLVFGRLLRALGLEVHIGRLIDVVEALQHIDPRRARRRVSHRAARCSCIGTRTSPIFDRAFDAFWRVHAGLARSPAGGLAVSADAPASDRSRRAGSETPPGADSRTRTPSRLESCRPGAMPTRSRTRTSPSSPPTSSPLARAALDRLDVEARRAPDAALGARARRRASICGARWRAACAPAATSSSCRGGGAARGRARSCCSATSAARWSATRACCCTSRTRSVARHRARRGVPVRDRG